MKWLRSTTQQTYTALGRVIPSYAQAPLAVADSVFDEISKMPVIKSLIKNGGIMVMDTYKNPIAETADANALAVLKQEAEQLKADLMAVKIERDTLQQQVAEAPAADAEELAQLKADNEAKDAEIDKLKADNEAKDAEIAKLKAELKEQKKLYKELKAEAEQKIAELSKE